MGKALGEGARLTSRGPSRIAETLVAMLLPPSCREEVLGDLHERYRSPLQYLGDVLRTVPMVILSRIRRRLRAVRVRLIERIHPVKSKTIVALTIIVFVGVTGALWIAAASTQLPAATVLRKSAPSLVLLCLWIVLLAMRRFWPNRRS